MVGQLKSAQRRRAVGRAALASGLVLLVVTGAALLASNPFGGQLPGGLACAHVKSLVAEYLADGLEPDLHEKVDRHLAHCEACRNFYASEREKASRLDTATGLALLTTAPAVGLLWLAVIGA